MNFRSILHLLIFTGITATSIAQDYSPSIVLLSPNEVTVNNKKLAKEISTHNETIAENRESHITNLEQRLKKESRPNIQLILQKQLKMGEGLDFYTVINSVANDFLIYRFFQYHELENLLIYGIPEKSDGSLSSLKSIAEKEKVQFVMNFSEVLTTMESGEKIMYITLQLYDANTHEIIFEKTQRGTSGNPGLEFTCNEGTLFCCINNALKPLLELTEKHVLARTPEIQAKRKLSEERKKVLIEMSKNGPAPAVTDMIKMQLSGAPVEGCFQGITNSDNTRMLALFVYDTQSEAFKKLDTKKDRNVKIISDRMTFGDDLGYYAFIVTATLYEGKWYTMRKQVQRFDAASLNEARVFYLQNLQEWNYFKEASSEINPAFWQTYFYVGLDDLKTKKITEIEAPARTLSNVEGELIHLIIEEKTKN